MSETQTVEHRNVGFYWTYSIETESVVPVEGTRASAKTTEKVSVGGNTVWYNDAMSQMKTAKTEIALTYLAKEVKK